MDVLRIKELKLTHENFMEELPVVIKNSHLVNSLLCELQDMSLSSKRYNFLDLSTRFGFFCLIHLKQQSFIQFFNLKQCSRKEYSFADWKRWRVRRWNNKVLELPQAIAKAKPFKAALFAKKSWPIMFIKIFVLKSVNLFYKSKRKLRIRQDVPEEKPHCLKKTSTRFTSRCRQFLASRHCSFQIK